MDTTKGKQRFLQALREGYSASGAAKRARMSRAWAYKLRLEDPEFARDWLEALEEGADWYEDKLRANAEAGDTTAQIVGLKMRGRFREPKPGVLVINAPGAIGKPEDQLSLEELRELLGLIEEEQKQLPPGDVQAS